MKKIFVIVMSFGFILAGLMGTSAAKTQVAPSTGPSGPSTIEPNTVDFNSGNLPSNFIPLGLCNALRTSCENGDYSMAPEGAPTSGIDCEALYDRCVNAAETNTTTSAE